ncbi:hypothetical protein KAU43_06265 [candidate division WOR-3 bacterium]|nr:hypothetical protein [candidate division WOR-3 bacterium]
MVYIYEILKDYSGEKHLIGNWDLHNEKLDGDDGKSEFGFIGFNIDKGEEVPLFKMKRLGFIEDLTEDDLLDILEQGRKFGAEFLERHGIKVPKPPKSYSTEKLKYIRARPKGETHWVYDKVKNRDNYEDDPDNDIIYEFEEVMITQEEFENMPEFTGW